MLGIGIVLIVVAGFIVILVFAVSPRVANAFTAAGTIALAAATVWLGLKTRDAVLVNEREMEQNREVLTITRQQADSADKTAKAADEQVQLTSRTLSLSSQPSVALEQGAPIWLAAENDDWVIVISLQNYGAGAAIVETRERLPKLKFFWEGEYEVFAMPESIVIPQGTSTSLTFRIAKSHTLRKGLPQTDESGNWTHATLEYWTMDISKDIHFRVFATFASKEHHAPPVVAVFTLRDIDFSPPSFFPTAMGKFDFTARADGNNQL